MNNDFSIYTISVAFLLHPVTYFSFLHWGCLLLHLRYLFIYSCPNDQLHLYLINVISVHPFVKYVSCMDEYRRELFMRVNEE